MQGGVIGGICLLAFLLSKGRAEETNGFNEYKFETPSDLKSGFNMATYEGPPYMFLNAKSRMIQPHEYIFPNKMPGYENVIQCTKENEFHHFWSEGVDCMTCICFNEYGILTPVCASCGGCRKPYTEPIPELPVPIPVQPATPKPTPIIPEPYFTPVKPEPIPEKPIPEPNLEVPTPQPYPKYPTTPGPSQITELIPTLPPQPAQATCNPLPSGQPFTNPLHPCQICICTESDMSGKGDVQIECKENPQCISPVDVNTLPPLPDAPMPIPLPICEKFPEHVLFPHPTDTCRLCKCSKRDAESGLPEQLITCYPHPDCTVKTEPVTEPVPSLPIPLDPYKEKPNPEPGPIPSEPMKGLLEPIIEPVPLPEIVTVEPLPWPPITTVSPGPPLPALTPPPGPLPGPSPHESCRPYPPNQTFQHPWDECQICLCTEATAVGMITVEVNCYTKPSCCIEPPDSVKSAISGYTRQYPVISNPLLLPAPDAVVTSTFRPPSIYPSYTPRPANVYPGTNQVAGADSVKQGYSPQTYPVLQTDTGYVDPSSNYLYPRNYQPPFVNQQYPEYPPRMPLRPGSFKLDDFGYQQNYQYAPGDAMENNYPGPRGHFQSYDPRFPPVNAPSAYPAMYQRTSYDKPPAYPPTPSRDVYGKPNQKQIGANVQNVQSNYLGSPARSKSGKDEDETDYS